jgi:hypothetical protein
MLTTIDAEEICEFHLLLSEDSFDREDGKSYEHEVNSCIGWLLGVLPLARCKLKRFVIDCGGDDPILHNDIIRALFVCLKQHCRGLTELVFCEGPYPNLRLWCLDDASCDLLGRLLPSLRKLRALLLYMDVYSEQGYVSILKGIAACKTLQSLALCVYDSHEMGHSAWAALQQVLGLLSLQSVGFSGVITLDLCAEIRWPPNLRAVATSLYVPKIPGDDDLCRFAKQICSSQVIVLSVAWSRFAISASGFCSFLRILSQSQLKSLQLNIAECIQEGGFVVHPSVWMCLRHFIKTIRSLQELGVGWLPYRSKEMPQWHLLKKVAAEMGVRISHITPQCGGLYIPTHLKPITA